MPKIEPDDKTRAPRDMFPLNPEMVRRLRAHDKQEAALRDTTAQAQFGSTESDN